jgi:hypothetical protein
LADPFLAEFYARLARMSRSDQRRLLLDCILEKLMRGCESTPAALVTRESLAPAKGPLPERLERLLNEYTAHPKHRPGIGAVMSATMADFGTRVFRKLLTAGRNRHDCDTGQEQNSHDVRAAAELLRILAVECHNTPILPRATGELLNRLANALDDVQRNSQPALFDGADGPARPPGQTCQGHLAAALEILIKGGMKLAAAKKWLAAEMRKAGLLDTAGNQISGERVESWRHYYRQKKGALHAREAYEEDLTAPLLRAPNDNGKREACQHLARRLVDDVAFFYNRTVPPRGLPRGRSRLERVPPPLKI